MKITTRVAHAGWDDNEWFGRPALAALAGRESYAALLATAVSGRALASDEAGVLDDIAVVLTDADPRIWPLKLTRLVASYGDPLPAFAAGNLCLHGAFIGHWVCGKAGELLVAARGELGDDPSDDALRAFVAARKRLMGYGVAFRPVDARWVALTRCIERRGRHDLPFYRLHAGLTRVVRELRDLPPNVASSIAAALLDLGFDPKQISALASALAQNNFVANAIEEANAPSLARLPASSVRYEGRPPRTSPRAEER